jgi:hypothetical protein
MTVLRVMVPWNSLRGLGLFGGVLVGRFKTTLASNIHGYVIRSVNKMPLTHT